MHASQQQYKTSIVMLECLQDVTRGMPKGDIASDLE